MIRKLRFFIAIVIAMVLSVQFCAVAFASDIKQNVKDKAIQKNEQYIKANFDSLFQKTKYSHTPAEKKGRLSDNNGNVYDVTLYDIDSEKLYDENGKSLNITSQTYAYDLSEAASVSSTGTGNSYVDLWDTSISVKGYVTIYYSYYANSDGINEYTLTQIAGGYTKSDSTVSISSQTVVYGMQGYSKTYGIVYKDSTIYPTTSSWSITTGYTSSVVLDVSANFGATYTIKLVRGTSAWSLVITNML
jgi:hypothetical protein